MKVGRYFELVRELPVESWRDLTHGRPFLIIAPHPDDETLGTGGLIALACRESQNPSLVLVTDGTGSHPGSRSHPPERLGAIRRAELGEATRILGLASQSVHYLGLPDTAVPTRGPNFERATNAISDLVQQNGAETVFVTWTFDPHCDHQAAALIAERVRDRHPGIRLMSYPIWGWHLPPADEVAAPQPRGVRVDISSVMAVKHRAIAAHVSQMTDLIADTPEGFRFTETTLAPFLGPFEYFIEVPS